jgi:hypothetical protein
MNEIQDRLKKIALIQKNICCKNLIYDVVISMFEGTDLAKTIKERISELNSILNGYTKITSSMMERVGVNNEREFRIRTEGETSGLREVLKTITSNKKVCVLI